MVDYGGARRVGDGLMNCMQHLFKMCEFGMVEPNNSKSICIFYNEVSTG